MTLTAFAALAALTLSPYPGVPASLHTRHASPHRRHHPQRPAEPGIPVADLYSARAKRRMANYLRMRLAELRRARLDRAAYVVSHHLPVDTLFGP